MRRMTGQRETHDLRGEGKKGERQEAHEGIDGGGDIARFGFDVGIEEAFADDAKGEQKHVVMDVAGARRIARSGSSGARSRR